MNISDFRDAISSHLSQWTSQLDYLCEYPSEHIAFSEITHHIKTALEGGKRTRALLLYAGMLCADDSNYPQALDAGCALELFQASALIHDDVIDNSPMRRGKPATHIALADAHTQAQWLGTPTDYGRGGAITIGDLLLAGASSQFEKALPHSTTTDALAALSLFNAMMTEVAYGQFLDIREENLPLDTADPIQRALAILTHKSARYSVEYPLAIGATLRGASPQLITQLRKLGLALGIAFQLRDDDLGIFGDPNITGKPACGDITEGKRTVLLALIRDKAAPADRTFIDSCLGHTLTPQQSTTIHNIARTTGARTEHEKLIKHYENEAERLLAHLPARPDGIQLLSTLISELAQRVA